MDLPTILYMIYRMVSVQQTNLSVRDDRIFSRRCHFLLGGRYAIYQTLLQYIISYGCAITIQYVCSIHPLPWYNVCNHLSILTSKRGLSTLRRRPAIAIWPVPVGQRWLDGQFQLDGANVVYTGVSNTYANTDTNMRATAMIGVSMPLVPVCMVSEGGRGV